MTSDQLGQAYALLTAFVWAFALVLFKRAGERFGPLALNIYKNCIGLVLLAATLGGLAAAGYETFDTIFGQPLRSVGILALSGIIGIALADTIFFYALNLTGVGLIVIADCAYCPFVILCSSLLLNERLGPAHYGGAALIILAVFIASRHKLPPDRTRGQIVAGMLLAMLAVGMMAFGIVIAKPTLAAPTTPLFWATTVRLAAATVLLTIFSLLTGSPRRQWAAFRPSVWWWYALPASVLGAYLSTVLWVAGFKYTLAGIAGVLNQTSVVFASVLAAIFLREEFGWRKILALGLAVAGVIVVTCHEPIESWLDPYLSAASPRP